MTALIESHRWAAHLWLPLAVSLALMGLYFSGVPALQAVVAPTVEPLEPYSWREFGLLEMLQNAVLLGTIVVLAGAWRQVTGPLLKAGIALSLAVLAFVLLEEVDYGRHFADWAAGQTGSLAPETWDRNLHNRTTEAGVQYGSYMRLAANLLVGVVFVVLPLLPLRSRNGLLSHLVPSRWMVVTALLMVALSWLAHALDDAGLAVINGVPGNLEDNISEFRELNLYYLFALYIAELAGRLQAATAGHR